MSKHTTDNPTVPDLLVEAGTDAAVVAELALSYKPTEILTVTDDDDDALELRVYGRDPDGATFRVETVDLERLRDRPRATVGEIQVSTPEALVTYVKRFLDEEASTFWGDVDAGKLTVILNDDVAGKPAHRDHRAVLQLQHSPDWKAVVGRNEKPFTQEELAEFIEDYRHVIVEPDSATMLEVAHTFQATSGATFKRAQSLHNGEVRLTYEEDVQASAGVAGETAVPREFVVALRPFLGTDPVRIRAHFRYRVTRGQLELGYRLLNVDDVRREAVEQVLAAVSEELGLAAIEGVAPGARR